MEATVFCVFCGANLIGKPTANVSAQTVLFAVSRGFRPPDSVFQTVGAGYGVSAEEARQMFMNDVYLLDTDWVVCPDCAKRVRNY
jgi:hypothetical protein